MVCHGDLRIFQDCEWMAPRGEKYTFRNHTYHGLSCYLNVCKQRGTPKKIPVNLRAVLAPTQLRLCWWGVPALPGILWNCSLFPGITQEFWDLPGSLGFTKNSWGQYRKGGFTKRTFKCMLRRGQKHVGSNSTDSTPLSYKKNDPPPLKIVC